MILEMNELKIRNNGTQADQYRVEKYQEQVPSVFLRFIK